MIFADKLIMGTKMFPTGLTPPSSYSLQTLVTLSNTASYQTGTLASSGWYRVQIGAADGVPTSGSGTMIPGYGGYASQIFYAFSGTKYIIWGCNGPTTGYPWPAGNGNTDDYGLLGGGGGRSSWTTTTSGGHFNPQTGTIVGQTTIVTSGSNGGGSATGNGGVNGTGETSVYYGTGGGGGAGFVCGVDWPGVNASPETEAFSDHTFSVDNVTTMVLAGGGAGCEGHSGGGGGAYGNGGAAAQPRTGYGPGTGPGGTTIGKGADGSSVNGGNGADGAWCIRDYSTNTFTSGTGQHSRPSAQICVLQKLIY